MIQFLQININWTIDYYLERISIKVADLFGAFSSFIVLLFVVMTFCSFVLWLILPYIELRKTKLLQKIHDHLVESEKLLVSLNKRFSDERDEESDDNPFTD